MDYKKEYSANDGGLLYSIFIVAIIASQFLLVFLLAALSGVIGVDYEKLIENPYTLWGIQGGMYLILLLVVVLYHVIGKVNFFKANGFGEKFGIVDFIMACVLGAGMLFTFMIFTYFLLLLLQALGYDINSGDGLVIDSLGTFLLGVVIIGVLPAIVEETVFRGAILKGYSKVFGTGAIFISAAFFMLMHMNPPQFVNTFLMGIVTAIMVKKTRTIKTGMVIHFINNFIVVLITYIGNLFPQAEASSGPLLFDLETVMSYGIYFVIGIIPFTLGIVYFFLKKPKEKLQPAFQTAGQLNYQQYAPDNREKYPPYNEMISASQIQPVNTGSKFYALAFALVGIIAAVGFTIYTILA